MVRMKVGQISKVAFKVQVWKIKDRIQLVTLLLLLCRNYIATTVYAALSTHFFFSCD